MIEKDFINSNIETISPVYSWTNRFRELFKQDSEIKMNFNEDTLTIEMIVDNPVKAACIRRLIPEKVKVDKKIVTINIVEANRFGGKNYIPEVVYEAFKGNPIFDYMYWWEDPTATTNPHCWVAMNKEPIFFPESDLSQVWGEAVELPQDMARDIMTEFTDHIHYCTNNPDRGAPDHNVKYFNEK